MLLHMPRQMPAHPHLPWPRSLAVPIISIPQSAPSHYHTYPHPHSQAHSTAHPHQPPPPPLPRISEIMPGLFVGDITAAESAPVLAAYKITHVLSAMRGSVHVPPELALRRLHIPLDDLPFSELAAYLPATTTFIQDALRADSAARVLVHCMQGISRSASVAAAYLMACYGWTASQAVQYIKSKRAVDPNLGFVSQLQEYEDSIRRSSLSCSISSSSPSSLSLSPAAAC